MNTHPGRPNGVAVDVDGRYQICGDDTDFVHHFTPNSRLDRSITIPTSKPAMYTPGGPGLGTLFVTLIRIGDDPLSGVTFTVCPDMTELSEPILHL